MTLINDDIVDDHVDDICDCVMLLVSFDDERCWPIRWHCDTFDNILMTIVDNDGDNCDGSLTDDDIHLLTTTFDILLTLTVRYWHCWLEGIGDDHLLLNTLVTLEAVSIPFCWRPAIDIPFWRSDTVIWYIYSTFHIVFGPVTFIWHLTLTHLWKFVPLWQWSDNLISTFVAIHLLSFIRPLLRLCWRNVYSITMTDNWFCHLFCVTITLLTSLCIYCVVIHSFHSILTQWCIWYSRHLFVDIDINRNLFSDDIQWRWHYLIWYCQWREWR